MEYNFRDKNYKVSKFKTFLTNELKKQEIETVYQFLLEFIQSNDFEYKDMLSILSRYIDYSHKFNVIEVKIYEFVNYNLEKYADKDKIENVLPTSNLIYQISADYSLKFIDENLDKIYNNTKEKVEILLFKADILIERKEFDKAFSLLRDCSNQSYDLYIFDSLELKRTIYEKMAIIGELEKKSDVAINYYIYYSAFQASLEFLHFPYLNTYRNFRIPYSIIENPNDEIISLGHHLDNRNLNINEFNSFLQEIYKVEIPRAFKLENLDIDTFSVSDSPIKELTYYSNYVMNLNVQELVSTIEFIVAQKIKNFR
ncbi:hypothetical protein [Sphingobacterium sp. CZ-2]|uniref:hypothetical protein n=1 Tax=Sphingobacterium sp. CZ-2 TaxID=2557994 RepID=UPI0010700CB5|nr:hypothetical protein [Sphingobacterium sp. CZ-2]QBR12776.1 hypothetical protein E3D81_11645 [Sphingobacterium sp. CZ-2]